MLLQLLFLMSWSESAKTFESLYGGNISKDSLHVKIFILSEITLPGPFSANLSHGQM